MSVPAIDHSFLPLLISSFGESSALKRKQAEQKELFFLAASFYLMHMHQRIMRSWKNYNETQKEVTRKRDHDHRAVEVRNQEKVYVARVGEGMHCESYVEAHRHLNFPI